MESDKVPPEAAKTIRESTMMVIGSLTAMVLEPRPKTPEEMAHRRALLDEMRSEHERFFDEMKAWVRRKCKGPAPTVPAVFLPPSVH